ncbi:CBS domain-containing protein [Geopsychrobacter electrodiphilus]|uniref:CBS domain-containing protein n=1 Tax=Geopsychrobacter electrodiphilus TaxID=225196 RepID=UPI000374DF71|nr:CBS domain-containing protein [Geopsychrobacter electrodiphilus]
MVKTVRDVLRSKGGIMYSVEADATVLSALALMAQEDVGALMVMDSGSLVGMLSERDYARKVVLHGLSSPMTKVRAIMTRDIYYTRPEQTVEECMALVTEKRCRHLPVMEADKLVGLISIGDLVKASIAEKEFIIGQLENYIKGG